MLRVRSLNTRQHRVTQQAQPLESKLGALPPPTFCFHQLLVVAITSIMKEYAKIYFLFQTCAAPPPHIHTHQQAVSMFPELCSLPTLQSALQPLPQQQWPEGAAAVVAAASQQQDAGQEVQVRARAVHLK